MHARILIWVTVVLVLFCSGAAYFIGYGFGHRAAVRDETKFGIVMYLGLYKLAEAGDTNTLQHDLRFLVFTSSDYYDRYFSNEVDTNQSFLRLLTEARAVASIERTNVVAFNPDEFARQINEYLRTNHESNAAIKQVLIQKNP
jgi:hypothetical protein